MGKRAGARERRPVSRRIALAALLASATLFAAACAPLRGRPQVHRYMLGAAALSPKLSAQYNLELRRVEGSAPYDDSALAYQTSRYRLDTYHFDRWVAPPTELVFEAVAEMLRQRGPTSAAASGQPVTFLDGWIKAFQEVDQEGGGRYGLVEIEFCLTPSQVFARPLWCRTIRHETAQTGNTAEAAVAAINASFEQVLSDLAAALAAQPAAKVSHGSPG